MNTAIGKLVRAELKLMTRDPLVLTFVFAFPIVTMLIIGGAFGTKPDPGFDFTNPAHWYVASYLTVVIAATGLVMLPVHLASYRERGVLRRFAAAGFPRWSFATAQLIVGLVTTAVACALLLAAVGAGRPGRRPADLLPVLLARRGRPAAARDGLGGPEGRGPDAADAADQRSARALAGPGHGHRVADHGRGAGGGGLDPGGAPYRAVTQAHRDTCAAELRPPGTGRP